MDISINELDLVKTKLAGSKQKFDKVGIQDWQISKGIPSDDIIWPNIGMIFEKAICRSIFASLIPLVVSCLVIFGLLALEAVFLHVLPTMAPLLLCLTSTVIVFFCFYCTPWLVFRAMQTETHYLKSMRESIYMRRLVLTELFNVIFIPILVHFLLMQFAPDGYRGRPDRETEMRQFDLETPKYEGMDRLFGSLSLINMANNKNYSDVIAYTDEYLLRFTLQAILMVILF